MTEPLLQHRSTSSEPLINKARPGDIGRPIMEQTVIMGWLDADDKLVVLPRLSWQDIDTKLDMGRG